MKRLIFVLCVFGLLLACTGCVIDREKTKTLVMNTVREKCDILLEDIQAGDFSDSEQINGITAIHPERDRTFIEYECGGYGIGSATSYWGFYYSEEDDMTRIWCAGEPLVPEGKGFLYQQPDGDNRYYTEHIIDHFYFYDASY